MTTPQHPLLRPWIILQRIAAASGLGLFLYLTLVPLAEHVEAAGTWLANHVGLWGVGAYVYVVDTLILPASVDLLFPFVLQWPAVPLLTVISTTSILAGISGYAIGRALNGIPAIGRRTRAWGTGHRELLQRRGAWAVAAAAALPLPFSTISWLAGALQIRFSHFLLAALLRAPRMVITYWLLREGILLLGLSAAATG